MTIMIKQNIFSAKELYLMECQRREYNQMPKRKRSAKARMETFNNMHLAREMQFTTTYGFPILQPYQGPVDFEVYAYSERHGLAGKNQAIHFFQYDCTFDNAVWKNLESTTYELRRFDFLFTPDYSLYVDDFLWHQNIDFTYKTRFCGAYWQKCGFKIIPTVSWGNANSLSMSIEGLPKHSVLAVCGIGNKRSSAHLDLWRYAIRYIDEHLEPLLIIVFGEQVEVSGIHTPLKFIPDFISKHFRQ